MLSLVCVALLTLVATINGQLNLDHFNSILGSAAADAGVPQCGISCVNDAFSWSKGSRSCFFDSHSLSCLCGPDLESGLLLCSSKTCASGAEAQLVVNTLKQICARISSTKVPSTSSITSAAVTSTSAVNTLVAAVTNSESVAGAPTTLRQATQTPSSLPQAEESSINSSAALSTAAKAGLGAGIAVVALGLAIAAMILWGRRKRDRTSTPLQSLSPTSYEDPDKSELACTETGGPRRFSELAGSGGFRESKAFYFVADLKREENTEAAHEIGGELSSPAQLYELESLQRFQAGKPADLDGSVPTPHGDPTSIFNPPVFSIPRRKVSSATLSSESGITSRTPLAGPVPSASDLYPSPQPKYHTAG